MLGKRIAALRRQNGLSQRELAVYLEVSPSAIGMYEQGRREPSVKQLVCIAARFEVSMDYLLTGKPRDGADPSALRAWAQELGAQARGAEIAHKDGAREPMPESYVQMLMAALLPENS